MNVKKTYLKDEPKPPPNSETLLKIKIASKIEIVFKIRTILQSQGPIITKKK